MIIVQCPHCEDYIEIEAINCGIFRHGQYQSNGIQLPPHSPKELCDKVYEEKVIYGCGKPFKVYIENDEVKTSICDYI
jgi:hypothetical protein